MTMYLPNPDINPTGSEVTEFIDLPPMAETGSTDSRANGPTERPEGPTVPLDPQTRLNITRWVEEYISGLVENHHGDPEDVRSIIHELHDQRPIADYDGSF